MSPIYTHYLLHPQSPGLSGLLTIRGAMVLVVSVSEPHLPNGHFSVDHFVFSGRKHPQDLQKLSLKNSQDLQISNLVN